jgi:hypothetical protein
LPASTAAGSAMIGAVIAGTPHNTATVPAVIAARRVYLMSILRFGQDGRVVVKR